MNKLLVSARAKYSTYHTLIYLSIISVLGELSYGVVNISALPPYIESIGLIRDLGLIIAMFLVVESILKSPMGSLGDRFGRRPLIVGGAMLSCATALGMTMARNLGFILTLRAIDGIAAAAIWPTLIATVGGSVKPEKRTTAMSVITATYIAGVALGPLLGGYVNDAVQSKTASFYLASILFAVTAIVAFFLTPHRSAEDTETAHQEESKFKSADLLVGLRAIPDMMIMAFVAFFGIGLLQPIIKLFTMSELGLSETGFGVLILPVAVIVAAFNFTAGRLGDRWGKARSVRYGLLLTAISMWGIVLSHFTWQFAVAGILLGIGFVLAMPAWLALVSDIAAPRVRGAVVGALGTAQGIGAVIGAYLGPKFYASVSIHVGSINIVPHYSPFVVSALSLTVCLVLAMIFIKDTDARRIGY